MALCKRRIKRIAKERVDRFDKEMAQRFLEVQKACRSFERPSEIDKFTWDLCSYVAVQVWEKIHA